MKAFQASKVQNANSANAKIKKPHKAAERKRVFSNNSDKGPPPKVILKEYAELPSDFIHHYAEPHETLTEEIGEILAEDINHKLRYVIQEALTCARTSSRNVISSDDVADICEQLGFKKTYGAPAYPNWIQGDQGLLYLEDNEVDLIETAFKEVLVLEPSETIITKKWLPEASPVSESLENYFRTLCKYVVSCDLELRKTALQNVSTNPNVGPIIEWFYQFGFLLLSKNIACDSVTLYALDLIETLELSPLGSIHVSEKLLKLIVRLLLQRLVRTHKNKNVLKPISWVLSILCHRPPLRELVMQKILENLEDVLKNSPLPLIILVNTLGIDAISKVVSNIGVFDRDISSDIHEAILDCYFKLCKLKIFNLEMENRLRDIKSEFSLVVFWQPKPQVVKQPENKDDIDFVGTKVRLMKSRRKIEPVKTYSNVRDIKSVFTPAEFKGNLKKVMDNHNADYAAFSISLRKQQFVTVGKTTGLLPVLRSTSKRTKCYDHTLMSYNL